MPKSPEASRKNIPSSESGDIVIPRILVDKKDNQGKKEGKADEVAFGGFAAEEYAKTYADVADATRGYIISEDGILKAVTPHLKVLQGRGIPPEILEVGAGNGRSSRRIEDGLRIYGVENNYELTTSEPSEAMINEGRKINPDHAPKVQASAEDLPFEDESFNVVYGSQTIHWWEDPKEGLEESYRVLTSDGMSVQAASGFLEGYGESHFTEDPVYKAYLNYIKDDLIAGLSLSRLNDTQV